MIKSANRNLLSTKVLVGASLLTGISIILTRVFSIMIPLAGLPALRFGFGAVPIIISGIIYGPIAGGLTGIVADLLGVMLNPQGGAFFPGFTLSAALRGVIPGLIYMILRSKKINFNIFNSLFILILTSGVMNLLYQREVLSIKNSWVYLYDERISLIYILLFILVVLSFMILPIVITKKEKLSNSNYSLDKILFTVSFPYIIISLGLNTLWLSIMFNKGFFIFLPGRILAGLVIIPMHAIIIYTLSKFFKYAK